MKKILTTLTLITLTACSFNSQAAAYNESNWYVTVDVEQIKSKVLPLLPTSNKNDVNFSFQDDVPEEIQQITLYGHSEAKDDLSIAISGDFAAFSMNEHIAELMVRVDEGSPISLSDTNGYNGRNIEHYIISDEDKSKSFYSAKISSELLVLSFEKSEIENWIDNKYDTNELHNTGLITMLVNIESAMAHMGADLQSNSKPFNSAVFQKVTQFSASVYESGENLAIDSALSTADEATAKQLEQVINGLIAMNALSNLDEKKPLLSALLSSLNITNQGNDLLISAEFALSLLPEINID